MSKKNSNAILKSQFKNFKNLKEIYLNFKIKLLKLRGKSFLVSVSGGPDSLALTALTKSYKLENNNVNFIYVLIDHRIRKNSSKEALAVKNLLKNRKISLKILVNKIKIDRNIQSQARDIRYQILTNFCKKNKINNILTGHNLEDQVETFFIRLSRGSGLTGLSAMKHSNLLTKNIRLSRPLLDVKKEKLIKISKLIFGKYFKDPSNNNDKYLRTKIRRLKIPLKKSGIKYEQIIKSINNLASSKAVLDGYLNNEFERLAKVSKSQIKINLKKFNHLRELSKMEIINKSIKSLRNNYYNPRSKKVLKLIENIKNSNFSKATLAGCLFAKNKQNLSIKNEKI